MAKNRRGVTFVLGELGQRPCIEFVGSQNVVGGVDELGEFFCCQGRNLVFGQGCNDRVFEVLADGIDEHTWWDRVEQDLTTVAEDDVLAGATSDVVGTLATKDNQWQVGASSADDVHVHVGDGVGHAVEFVTG